MSKVKLEKGSIFERYETKYLLNQNEYMAIYKELNRYMEVDEYGQHTIYTIYYDTEDFSIIRNCLEKPKFREKLRLRSYGVPSPEDTVFLELKKKSAGITYKRRISLALKEAISYMEYGDQTFPGSQIFNEIDWFNAKYNLEAKVLLIYDRIAMIGDADPDLRITFDHNVRWRDSNLRLEKANDDRALLPTDYYLMEIKSVAALPYWLAKMLSEYHIYPTSFSKFGTIYSNYLSTKERCRYAV